MKTCVSVARRRVWSVMSGDPSESQERALSTSRDTSLSHSVSKSKTQLATRSVRGLLHRRWLLKQNWSLPQCSFVSDTLLNLLPSNVVTATKQQHCQTTQSDCDNYDRGNVRISRLRCFSVSTQKFIIRNVYYKWNIQMTQKRNN